VKYKLKSLKHNGIYVPIYDFKGFSIRVQSEVIKLTPKSEQMAIAWIRKAQSILSPPDEVFKKNFMEDFLQQLRIENPSLSFLVSFSNNWIGKNEKNDPSISKKNNLGVNMKIDFSQISGYLEKEKMKKTEMSQIEKKRQRAERKVRREVLKEKTGFAIVDGKKLEIANWTAEPSCIFAGRGDHPKRGKWKEGPREENIILNLSPESPRPLGNWRDIIWEPEKMYVAKWTDKLTGKIKYVWFSDSAFLKQNREKEKFKKAEKLGKHIAKIERHIINNLEAEDEKRRKVATVCWLILKPNMRVGDEKDSDEADTVGAITLRAEHIEINGDVLHFDFLGKDSVRWNKSVKAPPSIMRNIEHYGKISKEYLFEGVDSKKVSRFLSEKMPDLTAKVFRTWRCTKTLKEYLDKAEVTREDPVFLKRFHAKMGNLKVAEVANHKRKISRTFKERLLKKETKLQELQAKLDKKRKEGKKTEALIARIKKAKLDMKLTKLTKEYNLATSLKSYIDPRAYVNWAKSIDFSLEKVYSKTLRKKFSWALESETECDFK
jgi:DNA topoisomerase-1